MCDPPNCGDDNVLKKIPKQHLVGGVLRRQSLTPKSHPKNHHENHTDKILQR